MEPLETKWNLFDKSVNVQREKPKKNSLNKWIQFCKSAKIAPCPNTNQRKPHLISFCFGEKKVVKLTSPLSVNISLFQFSPSSRIPQPDLQPLH